MHRQSRTTGKFINHTSRKILWSLSLLALFGSFLIPKFAFPHTSFTGVVAFDDFDQDDGGLGPEWTVISDGGMAIFSQMVTGTVGATTGDISKAASALNFWDLRLFSGDLTGRW